MMAASIATAQWTEPAGSGAAVPVRSAFLVRDADGSYTFAATGPADAYLVPDVDGTYVIDPAATSGARMPVFGNLVLLT